MRSRRQQQAQTLGEEVSQLRAANQQLMERLQITNQQHQDALQQVNLLRNELMTLKQTLVRVLSLAFLQFEMPPVMSIVHLRVGV